MKRVSNPEGTAFPGVEEVEQHFEAHPEDRTFAQANSRPAVLGTAEQVKQELLSMAEKFGADELMVVSITHDFDARCRSHELLAQIWDKH